LPHLDTLVKTADAMLASKATYLASLIQDERSINVLKTAASSKYPEVRVAAAAGARNLNVTAAEEILLKLLVDTDAGVREEAGKSWYKLRSIS
jgi:HEAT repeat protein